jgi:molybdopterin-guanine dinucleotide biosynthesis protein A
VKHFGLIVAGGRSSRFGSDKANALYKGHRFLDLARSTSEEIGADTTLILGRPGEPDGIADPQPNAGPARNIALWIKGVQKPCRITVLPVDMPGLDARVLAPLTSHPEGAYFDDLYLPFTATVHGEVHGNIERMRDLLGALNLAKIATPEKWAAKLKNINTQVELEAATEA